MSELMHWFDGFAKIAEASGITDPAEIQKLVMFYKRAELAAKHPEQFESGFNEQSKQAQFGPAQQQPGVSVPSMPNMPMLPGQQMPSSLYSTPAGLTAEDVTPNMGHHMFNYGAGGAGVGGAIGGILGKLLKNPTPPAHIPAGALKGPAATVGRFLQGLITRPRGGNVAILGAILGALYGAGKGKFMTGRYGQGSQVGMTPEGYMNRMEPEIGRMKSIRQRLYGAFGPQPGTMSPHAWYLNSQPGYGGQMGSQTW